MSRYRFEIKTEGIRELLVSDRVRDEMAKRGERVAAAARSMNPTVNGQAVLVDVVVGTRGRRRSHVFVRLDHEWGAGLEARERILGRSVDAAGGD